MFTQPERRESQRTAATLRGLRGATAASVSYRTCRAGVSKLLSLRATRRKIYQELRGEVIAS